MVIPLTLSHHVQQCQRRKCMMVGDRETAWEFDQPDPLQINSYVRRMLGGKGLEEAARYAGKELEGTSPERGVPVPHLIHMVWVGSSLPELYYRGPRSFATLNPDHKVYVWLDQPTSENFQEYKNIFVKNISEEFFETQDLIDRSTNMAMVSDIMRVELVIKYGGIYVDIDAMAKRPFGPIFDKPFLCLRPVEIESTDSEARGLIYNHIFGMNKESGFLHFLLKVMREDFDNSSATVERTGPHLWRKALLESEVTSPLQLIDWTFLLKPGHKAVVVDIPGDSVTNWWEMEGDKGESGPVYKIIKQLKNPRARIIFNL